MTWAKSLPVQSWDSIWSKSVVRGLPLKREQVSNQLLMFTMQFCAVLHKANGCFSVGNPELWAVDFVAFVHKLLGL